MQRPTKQRLQALTSAGKRLQPSLRTKQRNALRDALQRLAATPSPLPLGFVQYTPGLPKGNC